MLDRRSAERSGADRDETAPRSAPGRTSRVQAEAADDDIGAAEPMFAGGAAWEDIAPEEGEQMALGLAPSPSPDEGGDLEADDFLDEDLEAAGEDAEGEDGASDGAPEAGAAAAKRKPRRAVPSSAYATSHGKEMRNYRYRPGTRVTNTVSTAGGVTSEEEGDFGAPNEYKPSKVPRRYASQLLNTVSVDIGTVVGGKAPRYANGWALVFHKSFIERGRGKRVKVDTGDHTGWIRVRQLASSAARALARHQTQVRRELSRGKGSGHQAKVKGSPQTFSIQNEQMLTDEDAKSFFEFRIQGGSDSTPLGNYTLRPARYGDVIIGVWNPPGSGASGKRFGGSGGIRAFFPLNTSFRLADTGAMQIADTTGTGTSTWRYVRAQLNGETIYCWLLQSWRTPKGSGQNF